MPKQVAIIGAGISGLSLGWFLHRRDPDLKISIFEASDRPGGWICTRNHEGFLFEQGPRSLRPFGAGLDTLQLIEQLGLQDEVIVADPAAKTRYLWHQRRLHPVPHNFTSLLFSPLMKGCRGALLRECWKARGQEEESVYDFFTRRFNAAVADRFIDPMMTGIFAGDCRELSIQACFPTIVDLEKEYGSLIKGMFRRKKAIPKSAFVKKIQKASIYSFRSGMKTLVCTLAQKLEPYLHFKSAIRNLEDLSGYDHIYCAIPPQNLEQIWPNSKLVAISTASVASVHLGYSKNVLNYPGFGYLISSQEKEDILGTVFDSSVFPEQNVYPDHTRLTVMLGGIREHNLIEYDDRSLIQRALNSMEKHLGISCVPDAAFVSRAKNAVPQYRLGHRALIKSLEAELPANMTLLGNAFHGVSVNDCIAQARKILCH